MREASPGYLSIRCQNRVCVTTRTIDRGNEGSHSQLSKNGIPAALAVFHEPQAEYSTTVGCFWLKNVQQLRKSRSGSRASLFFKMCYLKNRFRHKLRLYLQRIPFVTCRLFFAWIVFSRKWVQISTETTPAAANATTSVRHISPAKGSCATWVAFDRGIRL